MLTAQARRLVLLLAALTALLLASCAGIAAASAIHGLGAQNRVWALMPAAPTPTGPTALESARSRPGSTVSATAMAAGFCVATEDTAGAVARELPPIAGGSLSISDKIAGQMADRGWTQQSIEDTITNPSATHSVWDYTGGGGREAATAYANSDGAYVVVNDGSGNVVQISDASDPGWKPVWNDPRFQR